MDLFTDNLVLFWIAFQTTVGLSSLSLVGALAIGAIITAMRVGPIASLRGGARAYIECVRSAPPLVLLLLFVFGLPKIGLQYSFFLSSAVVLTVYTSAFVAEALRSGINAIPHGQAEAARSLGLTFRQTMRHVVLPQSFRTVVPPLGNTLIILIKNTSLAAAVSVGELTKLSSRLITEEARPVEVLVIVGICYLMLTLPLASFVRRAEKKLVVVR